MLLPPATDSRRQQLPLSPAACVDNDPIARIVAVFGAGGPCLPKVGEDSLGRYHEHLSANLKLPFTAYYPHPTNRQEKAEFRCTVLELLDPRRDMYDEFDGLFCKVRKGKYEMNLPLIELEVPPDNPNFQLIEDYWYWFWNWR